MPPKTPKSGIETVATIKELLTRIGSGVGGKKDDLIARLSRDLRTTRRLPNSLSDPSTRKKTTTRILSIDMGIKNLAFCVADISRTPNATPKSSSPKSQSPLQTTTHMKISAWRRLDVMEEIALAVSSKESPTQPILPSAPIPEPSKPSFNLDADEEGPWTPSSLAKAADSLLKHTLLPYNPDIILIERQRWRSTNSPSIQQWTVRVNTLEGMLWAILTSLREETAVQTESGSRKNMQSKRHAYDVFGVDPKRVSSFWVRESERLNLATRAPEPPPRTKAKTKRSSKTSPGATSEPLELGPAGEVLDLSVPTLSKPTSKKAPSKSKIEKTIKIHLLHSWLANSPPCTLLPSPTTTKSDTENISHFPAINFHFTPETEKVKETVCSTSALVGSRHNAGALKIDDVTDCFLQAAAWVAWDGNRVGILEGWERKGGRDASEILEKEKKKGVKKGPRKSRKKTAIE